MTKRIPLSRESLGNRRYSYTAGVVQETDGSFELLVAATGTRGEYHMPDPSPEKRSFTASDLSELGTRAAAFLRAWRDAEPDRANQVTCCTKAVENAIARAGKKLVTLAEQADRMARR